MKKETIKKLVGAAIDRGYQFSSKEVEAIVHNLPKSFEDLKVLSLYTSRFDSVNTKVLFAVYKEMVTNQSVPGIESPEGTHPLRDKDLEAIYYVDRSELSQQARDKMKKFYFLHHADKSMQEELRTWLCGLIYCGLEGHLKNIESQLDKALSDVNGTAARLLRLFLFMAPETNNYDFSKLPQGIIYDDLDTGLSLVIIDGPETMDNNQQIAKEIRTRLKEKKTIELSLRAKQDPRAELETALGKFPINSEYSLRKSH